jgi:hypothetical protein
LVSDFENLVFSLSLVYVTDTLKTRRKVAMRNSMAVLYDLITEYTGPGSHCDNETNNEKQKLACDAMVLGSVTKGLAGPESWTPVDGLDERISFNDLVDEILEIDVLVADQCSSMGITHGVKDAIEASIESVESTLCGLDLTDFLPGLTAQADA